MRRGNGGASKYGASPIEPSFARSIQGKDVSEYIPAPRQNLWVDSGSGRAPSIGYEAVSAPWYVRKPKDFLEVGFALVLKPSTTPLEN